MVLITQQLKMGAKIGSNRRAVRSSVVGTIGVVITHTCEIVSLTLTSEPSAIMTMTPYYPYFMQWAVIVILNSTCRITQR